MKTFYAGGFLYNQKTKEVLLHKRDGNTKINPHKWAFFGGLAEGNETPVEAFIREMDEELGVKIPESDVCPLCDYLNVEQNLSIYFLHFKREEERRNGIGRRI